MGLTQYNKEMIYNVWKDHGYDYDAIRVIFVDLFGAHRIAACTDDAINRAVAEKQHEEDRKNRQKAALQVQIAEKEAQLCESRNLQVLIEQANEWKSKTEKFLEENGDDGNVPDILQHAEQLKMKLSSKLETSTECSALLAEIHQLSMDLSYEYLQIPEAMEFITTYQSNDVTADTNLTSLIANGTNYHGNKRKRQFIGSKENDTNKFLEVINDDPTDLLMKKRQTNKMLHGKLDTITSKIENACAIIDVKNTIDERKNESKQNPLPVRTSTTTEPFEIDDLDKKCETLDKDIYKLTDRLASMIQERVQMKPVALDKAKTSSIAILSPDIYGTHQFLLTHNVNSDIASSAVLKTTVGNIFNAFFPQAKTLVKNKYKTNRAPYIRLQNSHQKST